MLVHVPSMALVCLRCLPKYLILAWAYLHTSRNCGLIGKFSEPRSTSTSFRALVRISAQCAHFKRQVFADYSHVGCKLLTAPNIYSSLWFSPAQTFEHNWELLQRYSYSTQYLAPSKVFPFLHYCMITLSTGPMAWLSQGRVST